MLQRGESIGVFQLEGSAMRALMRALAPDSFDDVAALIALYRPGPMAANMHYDYADRKNGRKPITYLHPDMAEVLADTQGLMIYQESMMRVAQKFAGYSLEEADNLRKAAGKKVRAIMAKERAEVRGRVRASRLRTGPRGRPFRGHRALRRLCVQQEPRLRLRPGQLSDGVAQGATTPSSIWPPCSPASRTTRTAPPCTSPSAGLWASRCSFPTSTCRSPISRALPGGGAHGKGAIPFGLSAVRNVGEGLVERIVAEREAGGPFEDFYYFCERVDPVVLNKRTVESLIKAGAFDSLGHPRQGLCLVFEQIVDRTLARRREREQGVMSLFGDAADAGGAEPSSTTPGSPSPTSSSTRCSGWRSRRRCSAST